MRISRWILALVLTALALGATAWLVASVNELHDRLAKHSGALAVAFIATALVVAAVSALAAARVFWKLSRPERPPPKAPEDVIHAAEIQTERAQAVVAQVKDEAARARLSTELAGLRGDHHQRRFHVVVFGTASAGKTSLVNSLLGEHVGATEAVMGTTKTGEVHTHEVRGVDGTLLLTDTPGLSEASAGGALREYEARDLATRADLLLFVLDHDLVRSEFDPLVGLARQGKRSIVVLNKQDRFTDEDLAAILKKLRERLEGVVPPKDIVAVAASPRPLPVRVTDRDGTVRTVFEIEPPDLGALEDRIAAILRREGDSLRAGNLLLRAHLIGKQAQDQLGKERDERAQETIDKFQWIAAGAVFANPIPALDLMAAGAVQFQMISELAALYGVEISSAHLKMIGQQMVQMLLKLGLVEAATSLIAGLFKSSLVGYAAGGGVQAVSMAYLTHISGHAFAEYFAHGQTWGDGGMQAALVRQFDLNSRAEFLQEFAKQALQQVSHHVLKSVAEKATGGKLGGA